MARRKNGSVVERVESKGKRHRLDRPVIDATDAVMMPLTQLDIAKAKKKRHSYEIDQPENFGDCVLATCIQKVMGAEVMVTRNFAYVALTGEPHTRRYEVSARSREFIRLNDEKRFDEIPPNASMELIPPRPRYRLVAQRARVNAAGSRGKVGMGAKKGPWPDPHKGVLRNGVHMFDDLRPRVA